MMKRHDDSQRSHRLAVTFGDPYESLTARRAYASLPRLGFSRMPMKRHNDSQRSDRLAMAGTSPPPVAADSGWWLEWSESALDMVRRTCDDREFGNRTDADGASRRQAA